MRRLSFLLLPALLVSAVPGRTAEVVETRDGRKVILMDDKTWDYVLPREGKAVRSAADAVSVWETELTRAPEGGKEAVRLFLHYENHADKVVKGVKVRVNVADPFGKRVFRKLIKDPVTLPPGEKLRNKSYYVFEDDPAKTNEPFDVVAPLVDQNAAHVAVDVLEVAFEDGSLLLSK